MSGLVSGRPNIYCKTGWDARLTWLIKPRPDAARLAMDVRITNYDPATKRVSVEGRSTIFTKSSGNTYTGPIGGNS